MKLSWSYYYASYQTQMKAIHYISYFCSLSFLIAAAPYGFHNPATKVDAVNLDNLYKLNDSIYRSEQPGKDGMKELEAMGIKTIINLRNTKNNCREAKHTKLQLKSVPINTWTMDNDDIVAGLKAINTSEKPCLIHCWHGSDRTGVIIAAHRMVNQNWTKEEAIAEFKEKQYGYHEKWFPKLVNLLQDLDVEQMKKDLKEHST